LILLKHKMLCIGMPAQGGNVAEKRTLPTGYGPEYETGVLLLGGNDGSLSASNGAMPRRIGLRRNRLPSCKNSLGREGTVTVRRPSLRIQAPLVGL
jgi:hypothetical protein